MQWLLQLLDWDGRKGRPVVELEWLGLGLVGMEPTAIIEIEVGVVVVVVLR